MSTHLCIPTYYFGEEHTVRVYKIDAELRKVFPKCVCGASPPQSGRFLPRIGKFFPKKWKASLRRRGRLFHRCGMLLAWCHTHYHSSVVMKVKLVQTQSCLHVSGWQHQLRILPRMSSLGMKTLYITCAPTTGLLNS